MYERLLLVQSISRIVREMIWNPLGLAFQVGKTLTSMLDPGTRDVFAGNNQVLERIGLDFLGDIAMKAKSIFGIGVAILILRRI